MPAVHSEQDGRVVTLTIDNPPLQLQDRALMFELDAITRKIERDPSVGAVILTSAHPSSFLTHYDVFEMLRGASVTPDMPARLFSAGMRFVGAVDRLPGAERLLNLDPRLSGMLSLSRVQRVYVRMNRSAKVYVAAINGTAVAGGCEVALACDLRLMADDDSFKFGLTEPVLGFNPGGGGGQRLARAIGSSRALEILLEARHLSPREAEEVGLIHRVVEPDKLLEEAHQVAERLARRSPRAIWASKRAVYRGQSSRWPWGFNLDQSGMLWGIVAPSTKRALQVIVDQIGEMPDGVPSPWLHPKHLREWQNGTVTPFN